MFPATATTAAAAATASPATATAFFLFEQTLGQQQWTIDNDATATNDERERDDRRNGIGSDRQRRGSSNP